MESELNAPEDDGRGRLSSVKPQLDRCASGAQLGGNLVLGFEVRAGKAQDPQVMLDSIRDEKIAACVARAVQGAPVGGANGHGTASISLE